MRLESDFFSFITLITRIKYTQIDAGFVPQEHVMAYSFSIHFYEYRVKGCCV